MNSSIEIDKTKYFLGYHYGVGKVLALNIAPQPGMFFINGETNSLWVWNALNREWIDTNRVDSGMKGMLTDEEGNSPSDFVPSQKVGVKESYFYMAECDDVDANPNATPKTITFTHFKNGENSVSVTVRKTSIVTLFWNGTYWEVKVTSFINLNYSVYATKDNLNEEISRASQKDATFDVYIKGSDSSENSFSTTFELTYNVKALPYLIPKGATIYLSGDITEILAYTANNDTHYSIIKNGETTDRDISYIKNRSELGNLTLSYTYKGIITEIKDKDKRLTSAESSLEDLECLVYGGSKEQKLNIITSPAYIDLQERLTGYFKGYKVDLTPYIGKYDKVYFRGAEWDYPTDGSHMTRGMILDAEGNVESLVPYMAEKSNGWQSLPITENSKTLWATYCTKSEGGEVWTPEYVLLQNEGVEGIVSEVEKFDNGVDVILPSDIYILKGRVSQLFFRGFIKSSSPYRYDIKVQCDIGKTFSRYYEIDDKEGVIAAGDYPIRVEVRNDKLKVLGFAHSTIHLISTPQIEANLNVLCVGDSTAVSGDWVAELGRMINDDNLNFVGRKEGNNEKVRLEATGGWSWNSFITPEKDAIRFYISNCIGTPTKGSTLSIGNSKYTIIEINLTEGSGNILCSGNLPTQSSGVLIGDNVEMTYSSWLPEKFAPFHNNGKIDFKNYADSYCNGNIDIMVVHLGVNNSLWENSKAETAIAQAKKFIDAYFADFPNGKMIVSAIPMPDDGINVYANTYRENNINRYGTISSFLRYNKALYDMVEELKEKYNISYAPTNIFFDTDYGYPKTHKNVNARISSYKEMIGTNGVHPTQEGYYMFADGIAPVLSKIVD